MNWKIKAWLIENGSNISHTQYSYVLMKTVTMARFGIYWSCLSMDQSDGWSLYCSLYMGYIAGLFGWLVASFAILIFPAIRTMEYFTMECFIIMTVILVAYLSRETKALAENKE